MKTNFFKWYWQGQRKLIGPALNGIGILMIIGIIHDRFSFDPPFMFHISLLFITGVLGVYWSMTYKHYLDRTK